MKTVESHSASTAINTVTLPDYVKKKRNAAYTSHQIMIIRHAASEMYQQDTDMSTATRITQHGQQNATREKSM